MGRGVAAIHYLLVIRYLDMLPPCAVVGAETHMGVPGALSLKGGVYLRGPGWLHELWEPLTPAADTAGT
jgi:hypothetical protein